MPRIVVLSWMVEMLLLAACMPAEPVTPTFYEIMPLPNTAELTTAAPLIAPTVTPTASPIAFVLSDTPIPANGSSHAPDLVASVFTSLAPPICLGSHSRVGATVVVTNQGTGDAGPFMVDVDGTLQAVPQGLAAGGYLNLWFDATSFPVPWQQMHVTVDAANQVIEANETNNTVEMFVATLTPPLPCPTPTDSNGS